ncbi:porin [Paraburkholderia sp. HD33-4]|uniref:porin n=1 Tax=Paraburkholderia sp. HD33-4 TaxID=2883242 RepID=UPI001F3C5749|nr:porin [Paraburkholderia sp. HD33-4]
MEKSKLIGAAVIGVMAGAAHAQSSVTLYGLLDQGINYISNDGGHANWTNTSGVLNGPRWGLKGSEDLGGGLKAIFTLENGFSISSGALAQGRMFARQSYVGLSSARFGSVTLGRQYDSIIDYVQSLPSSNIYIGVGHPFDNDNLINSFRINNSIKYSSIDYNGLTFGGLYGFSNTPSNGEASGFAANRAWSLGANYKNGGLALAAGYIRLSSPNENTTGAIVGDYNNFSPTSALGSAGLPGAVQRQAIFATGISYQLSAVHLAFVYSNSRISSTGDNLTFSNYDVNMGYQIRPDVLLAATYTFTDGKLDSTGAKPKYHQVGLLGDYFVSKRTDLYLLGVFQRAAGDAPVASIAPDSYGAGGSFAPDASTSKSQLLLRAGIRTKF